jgi:hypothetical protein
MKITESVYVLDHAIISEFHSQIRYENIVDNIDDAIYIVTRTLNDYNEVWKKYSFAQLYNNLKPDQFLLMDMSGETVGVSEMEGLSSYKNLSKLIILCNDVKYDNDLYVSIQMKGCTILNLPFYIKYIDYFKPFKTDSVIPPKKFLMLTGKLNMHRTCMVGLVSYYDLIKHGYVSFFGEEVHNYWTGTYNPDVKLVTKISDYYDSHSPEEQKTKVKKGFEKLPKKLTVDVEHFTFSVAHNRTYNRDYYDAVDFVVVNETDVDQNWGSIHITEKTGKCIQLDKKFIVLGPTGILQKVKKDAKIHLGKDISHLTDWCDISYDTIENVWERIDKIVDIIKKETLELKNN